MAQPKERKTPKPKYKNTIVCKHCHAEFNPNVSWSVVTRSIGTTDDYAVLYDIPAGVCPFCRTKFIE